MDEERLETPLRHLSRALSGGKSLYNAKRRDYLCHLEMKFLKFLQMLESLSATR